MIRSASIEDSTYVPYAKTNKELTDDISKMGSEVNFPVSANMHYYTIISSENLNTDTKIKDFLDNHSFIQGINVVTVQLSSISNITGVFILQIPTPHYGVGVFLGYYYETAPVYCICKNDLWTVYTLNKSS